MLRRLRRDVEKAKEALREIEGTRRVLGGTTDAERRQLQAELAEEEKRLKERGRREGQMRNSPHVIRG